ncbi:permease-like cell division protein FtsX [Saccharibacillus sp. CPCC 101409]|uniref:permease-like cell division protein FtsX n=1 Tax=Saccharibacillus sp. CPCC 101409 TaxID=3058041 RepID=UPI00267134ED|nr:permease-like cell division protein FtsX [Saccharibacillus sp. CPCC 101409]MDO3412040.1 permease-like cell division protein FtsX [Saccharibacillus sp. CPCC 101409]
MNFNTLLRHFREGTKNVFRNGWMSVASMLSIVVSLMLLGVALLLVLNLDRAADRIDKQVEISVYLNLEITKAETDIIEQQIREMPEVQDMTFVSKEEGLETMRQSLGDAMVKGYEENGTNPLPDMFKVQVIEATTVPFVAEKISALNDSNPDKPVYDVDYGKGTAEKLFKWTQAIRTVGVVIVLALGLMAMFLIANTIKVTIIARRREIAIMKLVGATNRFIRWPFLIEGVLVGMTGAAITLAILLYGYYRVELAYSGWDTTQFTPLPLGDLWIWFSVLILGLGFLIGAWGSTISIRKFLKV